MITVDTATCLNLVQNILLINFSKIPPTTPVKEKKKFEGMMYSLYQE